MKNKLLLLIIGLLTNTQLIFSQVPSYVPTNGLVGYWPFNGNANDESGNANNGVVTGATLTLDRFGNNNSAYNFDGINDYINCNPLTGIQEISVSVWFNKTGLGGHLVSQNNWNSAENVSFASAYEKNSNNFTVGVNSGNCNFQGSQSITSIPYNLNSNWHHRVITINNLGLIRDFLDGQLINSSTISNFQWCNSTSAMLKFGGWWNFDIQSWEGKIDDIGIWNRVLTQQEITNLYNANLCIANITVTDTLIINVGQLSFNEPITWSNNITISPNPASSHININFNNITDLNGGTIKIINSLGQQVATTPITTTGTNTSMALNSWGGTGIYFVQILNSQGQIVDIKKIILQ